MVNRQVDGFMFKPLTGKKQRNQSCQSQMFKPPQLFHWHTWIIRAERHFWEEAIEESQKKTQLRGLDRFPALRWIHGVAPESNSLAPARPPCKNMSTSTALQCDSVMFIGPKGDHLQESHVSHFEDTLRRTKSSSWWYWNANYCQHVCGPKPYVSIRSHKFGTPAPTCQC